MYCMHLQAKLAVAEVLPLDTMLLHITDCTMKVHTTTSVDSENPVHDTVVWLVIVGHTPQLEVATT